MVTKPDNYKSVSGDYIEYPELMIADGHVDGLSVVHKFGRNAAIGTTFAPVVCGGNYRTPQVSGATQLRVKAGNANDTAAGSGARKVIIEGLLADGTLATEELTTNGTSAGANSTNSYIRLFRAYISESGTYATQSTGSHSADVVIENAAGTEDWAIIESADFPRSQSEIGAYTVPTGKVGYVKSLILSVDSSKTADVLFFQRQGILKTAAPYDAMRVVLELGGVSGEETVLPATPLGPFPAGTDLGFLAKVASGTAEVDVDFELFLVDE